MNTNTTRLIDIPSTILAVLIIIGGVVLLYFGKIDYVELTFFIVTGVGLVGYNVAIKAPSPAQAQQLSDLTATAQTHTDQITATQQQLGQVQAVATQAANTAAAVQQQVQAPAPVQGMVNLATAPHPQFMQPISQPVPQVHYVDYGRRFGDSVPVTAINTQKIPAV
jgi:hypothetical protein